MYKIHFPKYNNHEFKYIIYKDVLQKDLVKCSKCGQHASFNEYVFSKNNNHWFEYIPYDKYEYDEKSLTCDEQIIKNIIE